MLLKSYRRQDRLSYHVLSLSPSLSVFFNAFKNIPLYEGLKMRTGENFLIAIRLLFQGCQHDKALHNPSIV